MTFVVTKWVVPNFVLGDFDMLKACLIAQKEATPIVSDFKVDFHPSARLDFVDTNRAFSQSRHDVEWSSMGRGRRRHRTGRTRRRG